MAGSEYYRYGYFDKKVNISKMSDAFCVVFELN